MTQKIIIFRTKIGFILNFSTRFTSNDSNDHGISKGKKYNRCIYVIIIICRGNRLVTNSSCINQDLDGGFHATRKICQNRLQS